MTGRHAQSAWSSLARKFRATPDNPTPVAWPIAALFVGVFVGFFLIAAVLLGGK